MGEIDPEGKDLTEAGRIVVAGGGVRGQEGFDLVARFAQAIGASLGGTRVAVERGWIPLSRMIGKTGKRVGPRILIACGTSGAAHFQDGIEEAKTVIAINRDRNARIFKRADLKILGDLHPVISAILIRLQGRPPLPGEKIARPQPGASKIFTPPSHLSASERIDLILYGRGQEKKGTLVEEPPAEAAQRIVAFLREGMTALPNEN